MLDIWEDPSRPAEIEFVQCDIRDRAGVAAAMRGMDVVHHNVALVPLTKSGTKFWEVNVEGSRIAAEEALQAGVKVFIHMSSSSLFGAPLACPITDATPPHPVEIYGRAKLAGELAVREVLATAGLAADRHPPAHHPGRRPPRHFPDPLRVDIREPQRVRDRRRRT